MKRWSGTVAAILVVSLIAWSLFFFATPGAPLTAGETAVIVGAATGAVLLTRALAARLSRKRGTQHEE
jgi:hypothetical protein